MKIKIGPYTNYFGPYQLAEALCFWAKSEKDEYGVEDKPQWVHNFGEWLAHGSVEPDPKPGDEPRQLDRKRPTTLLSKFLEWIDSKKARKISVRIDPWDTWSMDHTLAYVILPMLKQLKQHKHGASNVDDEDVPQELQSTAAPPKENDWDTDANHFKRWDYVLDQMIFAFENKLDDTWENQFRSGESKLLSKVIEWDENLKPKLYQIVNDPNDSYKVDTDGLIAYQARISNGFRLFGKYYESLWS
jgi:hypothetical protein